MSSNFDFAHSLELRQWVGDRLRAGKSAGEVAREWTKANPSRPMSRNTVISANQRWCHVGRTKPVIEPRPAFDPQPANWTAELDAELIRRRDADESFSRIGRALGVTKDAAKRRYRILVPYNGPMPEIDAARLKSLWAEGKSYRVIGLAMGVSADTVNGWRLRVGLPARLKQQPPCNELELRWSDAERAVIIADGYTVSSGEIAKKLKGRTPDAVSKVRKRMVKEGLIERPAVMPKPKRVKVVKVVKVAAPKPVKVVKVKAAKPPPPPKPVRAEAPPLPPEPVVRELPPGTEILIRRPWKTIQAMALGMGMSLSGIHELDRFNRRREGQGLPPVYIAMGGASA